MQLQHFRSLGRTIRYESIYSTNQYTVRITDRTLADMEEIYNYIAIQLLVSENAMGQYNRIAKAIEEQNMFPKKVRLMESEPDRTIGL